MDTINKEYRGKKHSFFLKSGENNKITITLVKRRCSGYMIPEVLDSGSSDNFKNAFLSVYSKSQLIKNEQFVWIGDL